MDGFTTELAEKVLAKNLQHTFALKKVAGFRTRKGRELVLERERSKSVYIWAEDFDHVLKGIKVVNQKNPGLPYGRNQTRNSNLSDKNAPRLKQGHQAWYLEFESPESLDSFLCWYSER